MSALVFVTLLLVATGMNGFKLDLDSHSQSHWDITESAILNVTAQACQAVAQSEGRDFTFPAPLTPASLLEACGAKSSARKFAMNTFYIKAFNARVNTDYALMPSRHFDDESFEEGKKHITDGLDVVKANIRKENYVTARAKLGEILHTLQDFYSHSNWIEIGNTRPNTNLIKKDASIGNITSKNRPACRNCTENCTNNILEEILNEKLLTSAYFSPFPLNGKPAGKCSHGDSQDNTRHTEATGGINKDGVNSSHGHLHTKAAEAASAATVELLDDVRAAVGDRDFLRMVGVSPGKALCFVIDTTASMGYDIESVQDITSTLIMNLLGTTNEPSVYILVPYNDPGFGPVTKTMDFNVFKNAINALVPSGGGDEPEMALSGLELALTTAPFGSEIYLFTDASAKDTDLKNTVLALVETTQSVVNFVISEGTLQEPIYTDVAKASGGKVVKVSKENVYSAIQVFLDSSSSTLVTLLQATRNPGKSENFTFTVTETETNVTIFITGSKDFTLISPSGAVQDGLTGSLTTATQTVGDLFIIKLITGTGQWEIRMRSTDPYTLTITAKSSINFFFAFVKPSQVRSEGFAIETSRPLAGSNSTLIVVLCGSDQATLRDVHLVNSFGSGQLKGNIIGQENNHYLVHFDNIPSEELSVLVKLQSVSGTRSTAGISQRQSNTNIKPSFISVTSQSETVFEPGSTISTNITVSTRGKAGLFTIQVTNNKGFAVVHPATVTVPEGSSATATVQMTAPENTTSATEVTLTVAAQAPNASDVNYVVSQLTVFREVTDRSAPVFERLTPEPKCSNLCSNSTWQLSLRVTDNTAIDRVYARQGNGTLNTTRISGNETTVSYECSSCSPSVEIVAVDGVGNVGYFRHTVTETSTATTLNPTSALLTTPPVRPSTKAMTQTTEQPKSSTKRTTRQPTTPYTTTTQQTTATTTTPSHIFASKSPKTTAGTTDTTTTTTTTTTPTTTTTTTTTTETITKPTCTQPTNSQKLIEFSFFCFIIWLLGIFV